MDASIQSYGGNVFHSCAIYVARGFFSFHLCFESLFDVLLVVIQYYMPFIIECLFLYFISSSTMFKTNFLLGTIKVIWLDWFIWVLFHLTLESKVGGKHFTLIVELIVLIGVSLDTVHKHELG